MSLLSKLKIYFTLISLFSKLDKIFFSFQSKKLKKCLAHFVAPLTALQDQIL